MLKEKVTRILSEEFSGRELDELYDTFTEDDYLQVLEDAKERVFEKDFLWEIGRGRACEHCGKPTDLHGTLSQERCTECGLIYEP